MLADPQSINDGVTNHSFTRTSLGAGRSEWVWEGSTPASHKTLVISHQNAGKSIAPGAMPVRRSLIQLVTTEYDATLGKTAKLTTNLTFTVDPGSGLTAADALLHLAMLVDFLQTDGQADDILLGEI